MMLVQSMGCASYDSMDALDAPVGAFRNHVWAHRAYNLRYADCERPYSRDFEQGFLDGYQAVCNGEDGYVPAMPPHDYWGYQYQTAEGAKCVNAWFKGYPLGAAAAKRDGAGAFHDVYISKMIDSAVLQDKAKYVLPNDVPVVASGSQTDDSETSGVPQSSNFDPSIHVHSGVDAHPAGWERDHFKNR
jgi:hypothetical protein